MNNFKIVDELDYISGIALTQLVQGPGFSLQHHKTKRKIMTDTYEENIQ
jgi:hypothetical protein